jgi:DNA-binding XRE family transcriptional regulator
MQLNRGESGIMSSSKLPNSQASRIAQLKNGDAQDIFYYETIAMVAQEIRKYREVHKITNRDLAKMTGLTTSMISRIESGYQNTSLKTVCRVLSAIGSDIKIVPRNAK